jgi:2-amino-4-hydroxy-6-hydroxymethyldihydropteridine diphosphokinase
MASQVHLPSKQHHMVVVALGGNMPSTYGKPKETIDWASGCLSDRVGFAIRKSRLYRTPAFPAGSGPDFVNAAALFETDMSPDQVLQMCHDIEHDARRTRDVRWGQRTLDIDFIGFDGVVMPDHGTHDRWRDMPMDEQTRVTPDQLILPHPRLQDRSFVLVPMADVAPDLVHPILGLTTRQMLDARPAAEKASVRPLEVA